MKKERETKTNENQQPFPSCFAYPGEKIFIISRV
jgi:hypothetical protein